MITASELVELYQDAGLDRESAARFLGRSPRQFRRWLKDGAPEWAGRMLRMRAGWLDEYGWPGWRIRHGHLWCLDWKEGFVPGDLFAWWWHRQKRMGYDPEKDKTSAANGEVAQ